VWLTRAPADSALGDWIERVYTRRRRHSGIVMISAIVMISSVDYENRLTQTARAA
jgi:putative transposase